MEYNYNPEWILEVTRKCRNKCEHCLRGKAQSIDMDGDTIEQILDKFNIQSFLATGGEPLLNPVWLNIASVRCYSISFITSGNIPKKTQDKVISDVINISSDNNIEFYLGVSEDEFHPRGSFIEKLDNFGIEYSKHQTTKHHSPIAMGNAFFNLYGENLKSSVLIEEPMFYINVFGDIYPICDASYAFQKRFKHELCFGNVQDFSDENELYEKFCEKFKNQDCDIIANEYSLIVKTKGGETLINKSFDF